MYWFLGIGILSIILLILMFKYDKTRYGEGDVSPFLGFFIAITIICFLSYFYLHTKTSCKSINKILKNTTKNYVEYTESDFLFASNLYKYKENLQTHTICDEVSCIKAKENIMILLKEFPEVKNLYDEIQYKKNIQNNLK